MLKIELIPDFTYCIKTVAKREYADVLKQLLTLGQANKSLQEKLQILGLLLETPDFGKLRCESEKQIVEGRSVRFVVYLKNSIPMI
jgi:type II secretory pathway component PulF